MLMTGVIGEQPPGQSMNGAGPSPSVPEPTSVDQVLATIQAALSIDKDTRVAAETLLRGWEADAAPGFLSGLMRIAEQRDGVQEPLRLLAVVIAKNTVGSSWRKTLGTREWSRVPDEEKTVVRQAAMQLLLSDPSDRVAVQLALLLTNIARFDFPSRAEDLLQVLMSAASWETQLPPVAKLRALKALKQVLAGLTTKRFVIEPQAVSGGGMAVISDLKSLSMRITAERELFKTRLADCFAPLHQLFTIHAATFVAGSPGWDTAGPFAAAAAACLRELLYLCPSADTLPAGTQAVLEGIHAGCSAVVRGAPQGGASVVGPGGQALWVEQGGRLYEKLARLAIAYLDTAPLAFAEYVPYFLQLFVQSALIGLDAATVRAMRPKRRVLLVRFIAKALLSPFYRPEWVEAPTPAGLPADQLQRLMESRARAARAHQALAELLQGPACAALVEAVVAKYVALSSEELQEWQDDPESYARTMEVESAPDADTPRPIGVGLLLCMLEHGQEGVVQVLLGLAATLQQRPPSAEALLMREACYRCIGEGFNHVSSHINFVQWFEGELAQLLAAHTPPPGSGVGGQPNHSEQSLLAAVLTARALWLVGVCGGELPTAQWGVAYQMAVRYLAADDLVVALSAVTSLLGLLNLVMDDQATLEQLRAQQRAVQGSGAGSLAGRMSDAMRLQDVAAAQAGGMSGEEGVEDVLKENEAAIALASGRVEERLTALGGPQVMAAALHNCFALLARLEEVESMVRVLQLVSVLVEVMGDRLQPNLGIIASNLPQVWSRAERHSSAVAAAAASASSSLLDRDKQQRLQQQTQAQQAAVQEQQAALLQAGGAGGASTSGRAGSMAGGSPARGKPGALAAAKAVGREEGDTGAVVRLHSALIAVLTHLVGKLRHVALDDPHICGVVYPLLRHSTRLGTPESEVLVEEAFRLWTVTLGSLRVVPPQLRDLLENAAALLRRGRDNAALFPILEAYLLLDAADSLQPLASDMGTALASCINNATAAAVAASRTSSSGGMGGQHGAGVGHHVGTPMTAAASTGAGVPFSAETAAEASSAAALCDVLLQLFPPGAGTPGGGVGGGTGHSPVLALLGPALAAMAGCLAHPGLPPSGLNVKVVNVMEAFLEVLGRLWIVAPATFPELMTGVSQQQDQQQQQQPSAAASPGAGGGTPDAPHRLLDRWLTVSGARFLEELIGVRTMALLGRFRRRVATLSLSALVVSGALDAVLEPQQTIRMCSLAVQALSDDSAYKADQAELDGLDFQQDLAADTVLARRLTLSRADVVRRSDVHEAVRACLGKLCAGLGGAEPFLAALAQHGAGERLVLQLRMVMGGARLGPGGIIEGHETASDLDSAEPEDDLDAMLPQVADGSMPFASTGSSPE